MEASSIRLNLIPAEPPDEIDELGERLQEDSSEHDETDQLAEEINSLMPGEEQAEEADPESAVPIKIFKQKIAEVYVPQAYQVGSVTYLIRQIVLGCENLHDELKGEKY